MNEEVGCPLAGEALGVMGEEGGEIVVARVAVPGVEQRLRGLWRRGQRFGNGRFRTLQDGLLPPVTGSR